MHPDDENMLLVNGFDAFWRDRPLDLDRLRSISNLPRASQVGDDLARTEDRRIPGPSGLIPVRIYWPRTPKPVGIMVYFHGGGFVSGGLETGDGVCARLTALAGCVTVSVDYRLAPEHPFPAGVEDAYAATQWAIANAEVLGARASVAVAGESAGGTFATLVCQIARDRAAPSPIFQLLMYPGIDLDLDTPERTALAQRGWILTPALIGFTNSFYCARPEDWLEPYCVPGRSRVLAGLPPALLIVGECDPLRPEVAAYGRRLAAAGVTVRYSEYGGAVHGFVSGFDFIATARRALDDAAAALRRGLQA